MSGAASGSGGDTAAPPATVLTFNHGSSSLKFGLFHVSGDDATSLASGEIETLGNGKARLHAASTDGGVLVDRAIGAADHRESIGHIFGLLDGSALPAPTAIGHRVVHGGPALLDHVRIDAAVMEQLERARAFAPLHLPQALAVIHAARHHFPDVPQFACFDTAFHAGMPPVAATLPLSARLRELGLRRYGFHGLSCESIVRQLGPDLPERLIIAHLGNGASVTAVRAGRSVDTSMGLTPTGGLIMGTRTGDLDPGVLIHLLREHGYTAETLERLVDRESGLLGISGLDSDVRVLNPAATTNPAARLAIEMFRQSLGKTIASMAQVLGGADMIVFTGGIGEHDAAMRATAGASLAWLGVKVDPVRNDAGRGRISTDSSRIALRVLVSQEDMEIARHSVALLAGPPRCIAQ